MVFCGKCGKKNPDGQIYCFNCGNVLNTGDGKQSQEMREEPTEPLDQVLQDSGIRVYRPESKKHDTEDDGGLSYEDKIKIQKVRNFDQRRLDEIRRNYFIVSAIAGIVFIISFFVMKVEVTSTDPIHLFNEEVTMYDVMQIYDDYIEPLQQIMFIATIVGGLASFLFPTFVAPLFMIESLWAYSINLPELTGNGFSWGLEVANLELMYAIIVIMFVLMGIQAYFISKISKDFTIDNKGTLSLLYFGHK